MNHPDPDYHVPALHTTSPGTRWQTIRYTLLCFWTVVLSPAYLGLTIEIIQFIDHHGINFPLHVGGHTAALWAVIGALSTLVLNLSLLWMDRHTRLKPYAVSSATTVLTYRLFGAGIVTTMLLVGHMLITRRF